VRLTKYIGKENDSLIVNLYEFADIRNRKRCYDEKLQNKQHYKVLKKKF